MPVLAQRVVRFLEYVALSSWLASCAGASPSDSVASAGAAGSLVSAAGVGGGGGGQGPDSGGQAPLTAGSPASGSGGAPVGGGVSSVGGSGGSAGTTAIGGASGGAAGNAMSGASTGGTAVGGGPTGGAGAGGNAMGGAAIAGGGAGGNGNEYRPCPQNQACKIMPFGDSITDGYNADTPGGYRIELFRLAHQAGKNITFVGSGQNGPSMVDGVAFPQHHEGHSGWTIAPTGGRSGISTLVATAMPTYRPDIVLLMIGTNDAIDDYQMQQAPARLGMLIDSIYQQLPDVLIIVAQPIPSRGDAGKGDDVNLSARLKTYGEAIPAVVKQRTDAGKHLLVVDMYTPFAPNKSTLLEDQWHPNTQGYVLLAERWYTMLGPLL